LFVTNHAIQKAIHQNKLRDGEFIGHYLVGVYSRPNNQRVVLTSEVYPTGNPKIGPKERSLFDALAGKGVGAGVETLIKARLLKKFPNAQTRVSSVYASPERKGQVENAGLRVGEEVPLEREVKLWRSLVARKNREHRLSRTLRR
jgi:hypothetical protein